MPINPTGRRVRSGFTLIELLVVIGIILVLLGILLPVVTKVKTAAYKADTQAEISTISNAIVQYYGDFKAYPGPFSNDQIELGTTPALTDAANGTISYSGRISMSQNLTLGLDGGLTIYKGGSSTATGYYYDCTAVGQGPLTLSPTNPRRSSAYLNLPQKSISNGQFVDVSLDKGGDMGYQTAPTASPYNSYNTGIPVFIDHFPDNPLPILYLRARVGGQGVISNGHAPQALQYDLAQISQYTFVTNTFVAASGAPANVALGAPGYVGPDGKTYNIHGLAGIETVFNTVPADFIAGPPYGYNAGAYFWNRNATATGPVQTTGRPRSVDQFILISAGADGAYGTPDDITSYGDVMQ